MYETSSPSEDNSIVNDFLLALYYAQENNRDGIWKYYNSVVDTGRPTEYSNHYGITAVFHNDREAPQHLRDKYQFFFPYTDGVKEQTIVVDDESGKIEWSVELLNGNLAIVTTTISELSNGVNARAKTQMWKNADGIQNLPPKKRPQPDRVRHLFTDITQPEHISSILTTPVPTIQDFLQQLEECKTPDEVRELTRNIRKSDFADAFTAANFHLPTAISNETSLYWLDSEPPNGYLGWQYELTIKPDDMSYVWQVSAYSTEARKNILESVVVERNFHPSIETESKPNRQTTYNLRDPENSFNIKERVTLPQAVDILNPKTLTTHHMRNLQVAENAVYKDDDRNYSNAEPSSANHFQRLTLSKAERASSGFNFSKN